MLDRAEEDENVRVIVIRGRGNTFCAGANLNMLDSEFLGTTNNSVKIAQVSARTFDRAFNLAKPTVAVVEGHAVAGGAVRRRRPHLTEAHSRGCGTCSCRARTRSTRGAPVARSCVELKSNSGIEIAGV
jgi:1,4-dihydroxy-2-naphthoyl-CoA synthase